MSFQRYAYVTQCIKPSSKLALKPHINFRYILWGFYGHSSVETFGGLHIFFSKCRELAKDFVVAGTASESLYGACESMFKPDMVCCFTW